MRFGAIWLSCLVLLSACVTAPDPRYQCAAEEGGVSVRMLSANWYAAFPAANASGSERLSVSLWYELNLDPGPIADTRLFGGLGDHARLGVYFGRSHEQSVPAPTPPFYAEIRGGGVTTRRVLNRDGWANANGTALDAILGSADDVEISLYDSAGRRLNHGRIPRADLLAAEATIRRLTPELQTQLQNPEERCQPEDIIIMH